MIVSPLPIMIAAQMASIRGIGAGYAPPEDDGKRYLTHDVGDWVIFIIVLQMTIAAMVVFGYTVIRPVTSDPLWWVGVVIPANFSVFGSMACYYILFHGIGSDDRRRAAQKTSA